MSMRQHSIQVTIYKSKPLSWSRYGFQRRVLAHTEQQAIKGPKKPSVKPFKQENQQSNLYKKIEKQETLMNHILSNDNY